MVNHITILRSHSLTFKISELMDSSLLVVKGLIKGAAFFEMKNKNNEIKEEQIQTYLEIR